MALKKNFFFNCYYVNKLHYIYIIILFSILYSLSLYYFFTSILMAPLILFIPTLGMALKKIFFFGCHHVNKLRTLYLLILSNQSQRRYLIYILRNLYRITKTTVFPHFILLYYYDYYSFLVLLNLTLFFSPLPLK